MYTGGMYKDHFSKQAEQYAKHRPQYPPELFKYLSTIVQSHQCAWDCGTGNGQAAFGLTPYFDRIIATDPSQSQLDQAVKNSKILYQKASCEKTDIQARSIDLVTVAQAIHWFDFEKFYAEVKRVAKSGAVIAVWGYAKNEIKAAVDEIVVRYSTQIVGPYWEENVRWVDDGYRHIPFPFDEIKAPSFVIELQWTYEDLLGYLTSWSSTQAYIKDKGSNPLALIEKELQAKWGLPTEKKKVSWQLHMRVGKIKV